MPTNGKSAGVETMKAAALCRFDLRSLAGGPRWLSTLDTRHRSPGAPVAVAALWPLCCGFVAGLTSISSRVYRDVADVAGPGEGEAGVRHPAGRLTPPYRSSALHRRCR